MHEGKTLVQYWLVVLVSSYHNNGKILKYTLVFTTLKCAVIVVCSIQLLLVFTLVFTFTFSHIAEYLVTFFLFSI